ncbi:MAG: dockerin type I repeat-containing protein, partial [Oscillospiraceae bacterium]|nr:dockerin type I repeat-containing protein [Oscillospiraceae bacterium]
KVMTILKEHFDVENEEKFCLGVNQTADSKYFRYLVKTPYSGDEITLEQASELYDALADETEITNFLYYEAYKMIYVLDLPSFPECGIVGMFPTDGYDKILKCVTDNDLNCEVIISDSDECWQGYQCVVSFDASAGLDERLDVFKKIYAETGLYSLAGASHGIFNFMPENYVFLTDNEAQKEQDPDPAGDKSDGTITCGDIDASGTIDITDLKELSLALVGDKELTSEQKMAADVDGDGAVTLADLARLQQYLSKKITSF